MTDAGPPLTNPPSALDEWKSFIADLARPFAIYVTSAAAAVATVTITMRIATMDFSGAAIFVGAVFSGVGALYGLKAWENNTQAKQTAVIEVAKTTGSASSGG
jgi:hypothetical protein